MEPRRSAWESFPFLSTFARALRRERMVDRQHVRMRKIMKEISCRSIPSYGHPILFYFRARAKKSPRSASDDLSFLSFLFRARVKTRRGQPEKVRNDRRIPDKMWTLTACRAFSQGLFLLFLNRQLLSSFSYFSRARATRRGEG